MTPAQKPGKSKQDYRTPPEFLEALLKKLCIKCFKMDLAAEKENTVAEYYYSLTQLDDASVNDWNCQGNWAYCNPPFACLAPWVRKAWEESRRGAHVAMLVPAGVGANWWRDWVHRKADVLFLNGRLAFMPDKPKWLYPKDCAVLLYTPYSIGGYDVWDWRKW